ncbi:YhcG family protein [Niastella sp. OAS944]|uniref:PDDEXK nuclease domain-containing protein n=1 Tax=Niastella sp. OAS944 TaxID=2664089 RepID=UPI0034982306|nr:putative nuclease of restriction endonuclease-like (RecB) superfamily [Chitinophagaceae bacterium OAS944]
MVEVDQNYHVVFKQLVETINGSRQKVISVANTELLTTYWKIGRTIVEQKEKASWGKKIIEKLANDLRAKFPNMKGLSQRNLEYMQTFAVAWPFFPFTQPSVAQLPTVGQREDRPIPQSAIAELQFNGNQNIEQNQSLLLQIPWTHHTIILDRVKTLAERIFYIKETIRNGWTANMLKINIETKLHERKGNAITTNFDMRLSENQAELARLTLKNPYIFDFLDIEGPIHERDLERALTKHIQRFLLELGKGFAYVGNQFNVKVQEDEFALDLLFFNYNLNCFVVFELKVSDFKSEYAGKLNFYVNIIDDKIKLPLHNPTIGVLLCKTPNDMVVKYSLQGIQTPLGVAEYELMPTQLKAEMPTVEELEQELGRDLESMINTTEEKNSNAKEEVKGEI